MRKQIIAAAHEFHRRGWVANHDGNITVRLAADRFLATPTATSKADVDRSNLIEVDSSGKKVAGTARAFSELAIHLAVYAARSDVGAVVHAHPPHATAVGCSGSAVLTMPFVAEAVVSIGASIPTLPAPPPGEAAASVVAEASADFDAVLCAGNGVFAWGADLEQARLRLELVEHLAKIATLASAHGGVRVLDAAAVAALLAKRAKSGLGAAADRAAARKTVIACAPALHANVNVADSSGPRRAALAAVVRDEIIAVLRDSEQ